MSARYAITSDWREVQRDTLEGVRGNGAGSFEADVTIVHEAADIRDTRAGWTYDDGAHRVRSFYVRDGKSHERAKTFYGEMAWANAEREYGDRVYAIMYRR